MHHQPDGAAFDVVLLLHVGCVVVGLVTTVDRGRHRRPAPPPPRLGRRRCPSPLRRYFRPGVNWAGRTVYGIPVFGFALLAMSQGAYALGDGWVLGGLALFAAVALLAEGVMWPAERRLQAAVDRRRDGRRHGAGTHVDGPRCDADGPGGRALPWSSWWRGRSSWWPSPELTRRTGPPRGPVLVCHVMSLPRSVSRSPLRSAAAAAPQLGGGRCRPAAPHPSRRRTDRHRRRRPSRRHRSRRRRNRPPRRTTSRTTGSRCYRRRRRSPSPSRRPG